MLRRKCVLKPTLELHDEFTVNLTRWKDIPEDYEYKIEGQNLMQYMNQLNHSIFPPEASLSNINDIFNIKPCNVKEKFENRRLITLKLITQKSLSFSTRRQDRPQTRESSEIMIFWGFFNYDKNANIDNQHILKQQN